MSGDGGRSKRASFSDRICSWWFADEPIPPRYRAWFYSLLLVYMIPRGSGPIAEAINRYNNIHPHLMPRWPVYAIGSAFLGGSRGIMFLTNTMWVLWTTATYCAVTSAFKLPHVSSTRNRVERVALAGIGIGFACLHGIQSQMEDYQHQYYSVLYATAALGIVGIEGRFSRMGYAPITVFAPHCSCWPGPG